MADVGSVNTEYTAAQGTHDAEMAEKAQWEGQAEE